MNRKLASITLATLALAGIGGGTVAALDDGSDDPGGVALAAQAVTIDVDAKDTAGQALRGVDVSVLDVNDKIIDTDTTDAAGDAEVSIGTPGQYRIVAAPPAGYTDRDDTDGNSTSTTRVNCVDVLRCTHVDVTATAFSFPFAAYDNSAWFEFTPPAATVTAVETPQEPETEDETVEITVDTETDGVDGEPNRPTARAEKTPPATTPVTSTPTPSSPVVDTQAADEAFARGYEDGYVAGFDGVDLYSPVPGYEGDYAEGYAMGSEDGVADNWALQVADDEAFELGFADGYSSGHEGLDSYTPVVGHEAAYDNGYAFGLETAFAELEAAAGDAEVAAADDAAFWLGYEDGYHEICDPGTSGFAPVVGHEQAYAEGYDTGLASGQLDCAVG